MISHAVQGNVKNRLVNSTPLLIWKILLEKLLRVLIILIIVF